MIFISSQDSGGKKDGVPIVLTASAAEMSRFDYDAFTAFICTFPHKIVRPWLSKWLVSMDNEDGSTKYAPYGLRKAEAILINAFGQENVITVHPTNLEKFVGKNTKVIGVYSMDPMGLAYVSTTYNSMVGFGGEGVNAYEFRTMMENPAMKKSSAKKIAGGAGVWQIRDANSQEAYDIDVLVAGEGEKDLAPLVRKLLNGEKVDSYINMEKPDYSLVPIIKNASTYGSIEITRGCGRNCHFCSPTMRTKHSFPLEHIIKEIELNTKAGNKMVFIVSEDIFLYKSKPGFIPDRAELVKLFSTIAKYPGVEWIDLSHASLAPIIHDPKILDELTPILIEKAKRELKGEKYITVEVGIETGSVRLMKKHMRGKALPYSVDNWPDLVVQGIGLMNDHGWNPLCTFMVGTPDETEDDVIASLELLDQLKGSKMFYTPVLFIPLDDALLRNESRADLHHINELQWEFILTCWKHNIDVWIEKKDAFFYRMLALAFYWLFVRWKHGGKATIPMMKLVGLPISSVGFKYNKQCEPELCPERNSGKDDEIKRDNGVETEATTSQDVKANSED